MAEEKEIVLVEEESKELALIEPVSKVSLLQFAMSKGASIEEIRELMLLQKDIDATEALKAFNKAMSLFRAEAPTITKDRLVSFDTSAGNTNYKHATLGNVVSTIAEALSNHGLSHRWRTEQIENGLIKVTCIITHELGHSESTSLQASPDASGKKNNIQAIGSTVSYLERYTLLAASGCATEEQDDDAVTIDRSSLSKEQLSIINSLIGVVGGETALCDYYNVDSIEYLQVRDYDDAIKNLERKVKAKGNKNA